MTTDQERQLHNLFVLAGKFREEGDYERAIEQMEKALKLAPDMPQAKFGLARLCYECRRFNRATELFLQLLEIAPDQEVRATYLHHLGDMAMMQGFMEDAIDYYERLQETWGREEAGICANIGSCYSSMGQTGEAEAYFRKAQALDPNHDGAAVGFAEIALEQGDLKKAQQSLKDVVGRNPDYLPALELLGQVHVEMGQLDEAEKVLRHLLEIDPTNPPGHRWLGRVYVDRYNWNAAIAEGQQILAVIPDDDEAWREIGWAHTMNGEFDEGIKHLQRALQIEPGNLRARQELAISFSSAGRLDDAAREAKKVLRQDPNNPMMQQFLAVTEHGPPAVRWPGGFRQASARGGRQGHAYGIHDRSLEAGR